MKGRGSNKRRAKHQKDKGESIAGGAIKIQALQERAIKVQAERRYTPVGRSVKKAQKESDKRAEARRKARRKWL